MTQVKHMKWPCHLAGRTHLMNGKVREVNRYFEGYNTDIKATALKVLESRADQGAPWYGDTIYVSTPDGLRITIEVPWPEPN